MRFFITNLLATALVVFAAGSASAIGLTLAGANGQLVGVGDSVTVTVTLDADVTGIVLISTGVLFDDTILSYNQGASSSPTYILYVNGKTPYMTPNFNPPVIRIGTTNQVNVDWTSTSLTEGTGAMGTGNLAHLVFNVSAPGNWGTVNLSLTNAGNIFQTAGGVNQVGVVSPDGLTITVPEPGIAGLSLAALFTVGALRTRSRWQR